MVLFFFNLTVTGIQEKNHIKVRFIFMILAELTLFKLPVSVILSHLAPPRAASNNAAESCLHKYFINNTRQCQNQTHTQLVLCSLTYTLHECHIICGSGRYV